MARTRFIKPGFFTDEKVVEMHFVTRLLFIGLWTLADREGRLEDKPKQIKMQLFPADNVKVDEALSELHQSALILRYSVDNKGYIQIVNFLEHQYPHQNEKDSEIPAPKDSQSNPSLVLITSTPNTSTQITDKPENKVFEHWKIIHQKPKAQFTTERKRRVLARLKDSSIDEILLAVEGCKKSPHHQGQNDKGTVYDDLELICRSRGHLERFISYNNGNGSSGKRDTNSQETTQEALARIGVLN